MKKKVNLSGYSLLISMLSLGILLWLLNSVENIAGVMTIGIILLVWVALLFFYMPLYVTLDDENLTVHRPMRKRELPLSEIEEIRLCPPTMGERRLMGSSGFFGYWGWFRERDLGKYFAYYGRSSDCFFVRMKDGRQYMIGCEDPGQIVGEVKANLSI